MEDDDSFRAGKVLLHLEVEELAISMLEVFDLVQRDTNLCRAVWRTRGPDSYKLSDTKDILDAVVYSFVADGLYNVLMPLEFR